jgi:two-component system sensor histidine kinase/response regulator
MNAPLPEDTAASLDILLDHLPVMVYGLDPQGLFCLWNRASEEVLGYPKEQVLGTTRLDLFQRMYPDPEYRDWVRAQIASHYYKDLETSVTTATGTTRIVSWSNFSARVRIPGLAVWGVGIDVTERRHTEDSLRENERLMNSVLGQLPGLAYRCLVDQRWTVLFAAGRFQPIAGIDTEDLIAGRIHYGEILHPDDAEYCQRTVAEALARREPYENEHRIFDREGNVKWILARGRGIFADDGTFRYLDGLNIDITQHKQTEEALRQANSRLDLAVRGSNIGIWENYLADADFRGGRLHCINIFEQLGYPAPTGPIDYATMAAPIHPDDRPHVEEAVRAYFAGTTPEFQVEFRARHRDGSYRWILSRGVVVRDEAGKPIRFAGTRIDISDLKRIQEELRQAKEVAEAASRAKSEFLANVSHEIRTPMNAILGMTELALDTRLSDEQRNYLGIVHSSANALLDVINDLLDFSKIEAGKLELDPADFSLRSLLHETLRALALRAHKKGLELLCHLQPDVPDALFGDAGRLRQVLLNLVGNAVKFTDKGEVEVSVGTGGPPLSDGRPTGEPPVPGMVELHFTVRDTGIGIPADKRDTIFQAFEQGDNSTTRRYGGTGLGLSIASRLAALMGGRIIVESEVGRGSTFHFTARLRESDQAHAVSSCHPPLDLRGLRILIVDDNATNRLILQEWLRDWRAEATAVPDGLSALGTLWQAAAEGRPYALVLLDGRMPGIDGLALAAEVNRSPQLSNCRIILLTSDDQPGDVARRRQLGIVAALMKPIAQEELLDTVYRVLSRSQAEVAPEPPTDGEAPQGETPGPVQRPLRILVAEDNVLNQQVVQHLLSRLGHSVRMVGDGRQTLAAVEEEAFDLLLLDVHMPELDGFQVIQALRQREQATGRHLPVVALTARSMKGDRARCLEAGMDDYLAKPIRRAELFAAIERVLAGRTADAAAEEETSAEADGLLDAATLLKSCDGDAVLLSQMIVVFRKTAPAHLAEVGAALRARHAAQLRQSAHKLRGLLLAFSADAAAAALALEQQATAGQLDGAEDQFTTLANLVDALDPLLANLTLEELQGRLAPSERCLPQATPATPLPAGLSTRYEG